VLAVFFITRLALVAIAVVAGFFPNNQGYPITSAAERGWQFTPVHLVDVWGRWDSGWYFDLIEHGYYAPGDIRTVPSNLGFFPVYPYLVKALTQWGPAALRSPARRCWRACWCRSVVAGRAGAAAGVGGTADGRRGRGAPDGFICCCFHRFFFSAFYTEARSYSSRWRRCTRRSGKLVLGVRGGGVALAALGILIGLPLAWRYARQQVEPAGTCAGTSSFALLPGSFLAFCYWRYTRRATSGDHSHPAGLGARLCLAVGTLLHPTGVVPCRWWC
jgi:hypothetical protein